MPSFEKNGGGELHWSFYGLGPIFRMQKFLSKAPFVMRFSDENLYFSKKNFGPALAALTIFAARPSPRPENLGH